MNGPLGAFLGFGIFLCLAAFFAGVFLVNAYSIGYRAPRWQYWLLLAALPGSVIVGYVVGTTS